MFTAKTPGSYCVKANISMKSSLLIHFFFTISRSMRGIIAYPPPIVNIPILAKVKKSNMYFIISKGNFLLQSNLILSIYPS